MSETNFPTNLFSINIAARKRFYERALHLLVADKIRMSENSKDWGHHRQYEDKIQQHGGGVYNLCVECGYFPCIARHRGEIQMVGWVDLGGWGMKYVHR